MYTPLELDQLEFSKKAFGGYDQNDVDQIFEVLKKDYETIYLESADMKKELKDLRSQLEESKDMKETLQNALISAQKSSDTIKELAEKEAAFTISKAEDEAEQLRKKAYEDIANLTAKKEALKQEINAFSVRISALFAAQIKILEDCSREN
ncbi:MAG: DivIVA domain-containing protein [Bacillota bacterium]|nr:DivIVA domain-containing protein [Bacillota bacterium]